MYRPGANLGSCPFGAAGYPVFLIVIEPGPPSPTSTAVPTPTRVPPTPTSIPPTPTSAAGLGAATVVEAVVDGDTLRVSIDVQIETVCMIGVDTPETRHPAQRVQCFGPEATAFTQE